MYDFKPDPLIQAFDKAANEPIQNLIEKYLGGDEKAGWTINTRLATWLTSNDHLYIKQFVAKYDNQELHSAEVDCLLGMIFIFQIMGDNIAVNRTKARSFYTEAMKHKHTLAFIKYGRTFASEDPATAIQYYELALKQYPNHPLALRYLVGLQQAQDPDAAYEQLQLATIEFCLNKVFLALYTSKREPGKAFSLYLEAAPYGSVEALGSLATFYDGTIAECRDVVDPNLNLAAYYYRVVGNPSCLGDQRHYDHINTHLSKLVKDNPQNTVIAYHHSIFLQDYSKLKTLFVSHPEKFIEYVVTYDLHRLQYEPWLKQHLEKLAAEPAVNPQQGQASHCLRALLTLATLEDSPANKRTRLEAAADSLAQITSITDIQPPFVLIILQACSQVNHELAKLSRVDEKSAAIDLPPKLATPTTSFIDENCKALFASFAPHTRQKQAVTPKDVAKEQRADLFDLQHYLTLDASKWRLEDRKQLRRATYGSILSTLAELQATQADEKEDAVRKTAVKETLSSILGNALAKEQTFKQGPTQEFSDILRGLQNNLDQIIREYQCFSMLFRKDQQALQKQEQNTTYSKTLALLQQPPEMQAAAKTADKDSSTQPIGRGASYLEASDDYAGTVLRESNQQQKGLKVPDAGGKPNKEKCLVM